MTPDSTELPEHDPGTYRVAAITFLVLALLAGGFAYVALSAPVEDSEPTGEGMVDTIGEGMSGARARQTGWVAAGAAVLFGLLAATCFWKAARRVE